MPWRCRKSLWDWDQIWLLSLYNLTNVGLRCSVSCSSVAANRFVVLKVACVNHTHYLVVFKLFYKSAVLVFTMLETNTELGFFCLIGWHKRGSGLWNEMLLLHCACQKYSALRTKLHARHISSKALGIPKTPNLNVTSHEAVAVLNLSLLCQGICNWFIVANTLQCVFNLLSCFTISQSWWSLQLQVLDWLALWALWKSCLEL